MSTSWCIAVANKFKTARENQPDEVEKAPIQLPAASHRPAGADLNIGMGEQENGPADHPQTIMRQVTRTQTLLIPPVELEWQDVGCKYKNGSSVKTVLEGKCDKVLNSNMGFFCLQGPQTLKQSCLL